MEQNNKLFSRRTDYKDCCGDINMNIIERFADSIVVPVVVLENVKNAVPTALPFV